MDIQEMQMLIAEKIDALSRANIIGWIFWVMILALVCTLFFFPKAESAEITTSYYTVESCRREGTSGITASGERLNDNKLTAAMWGVPFGTLVKVMNVANGKSVIVRINDRGPAKRLVKKGRIIDLSKRAFSAISDLRQGVIVVKVYYARAK
jgi:rare lipoprotein A